MAVRTALTFVGMRGEFERFPQIHEGLSESRSWIHAPAVFLEAAAVAFVLVRLQWVTRPAIALIVPCLLFAAAHFPSGIASGRTPLELIAFFVFNAGLAAAIFSVVMKSRDIVWIAVPHFVLDIAIGAFE